MLAINIPKVEPLFLNAFLRFYNVKLERMSLVKLKRGYTISDQNLVNMITLAFSQFKRWEIATGKTIDDYMNRQIVFVKVTDGVANVTVTEIHRKPLFIVKSRQHKNSYLHGEFGFSSKHPIKLDLDFICELNNLPKLTELSFESCPPSINLVKVDNNVAFTDGDTPGYLAEKVTIGKSETHFYWIPNNSIVQKRFYCTKLPGICEVYFKTKQHLSDHMKICTNETKIKSYQVSINRIFYYTHVSLQATYGCDSSLLKQAIKMKYLPESFASYRQQFLACWDIETLEAKQDLQTDTATQIEAVHNIVSIRY